MTKSEFKPIMQKLKIAYGEKRFPLSDEIMDVWYEYLGEFKSEDVSAAIKVHILEECYPPTIFDLVSKVRKKIEGREKEEAEIKNLLFRTMETYPYYGNAGKVKEKFYELSAGSITKAKGIYDAVLMILYNAEKYPSARPYEKLDDILEAMK